MTAISAMPRPVSGLVAPSATCFAITFDRLTRISCRERRMTCGAGRQAGVALFYFALALDYFGTALDCFGTALDSIEPKEDSNAAFLDNFMAKHSSSGPAQSNFIVK